MREKKYYINVTSDGIEVCLPKKRVCIICANNYETDNMESIDCVCNECKDKTTLCANCGNITMKDDKYKRGETQYCNFCHGTLFKECISCHTVHKKINIHCVDTNLGLWMCTPCRKIAPKCDVCGIIVSKRDAVTQKTKYFAEMVLCSSCFGKSKKAILGNPKVDINSPHLNTRRNLLRRKK